MTRISLTAGIATATPMSVNEAPRSRRWSGRKYDASASLTPPTKPVKRKGFQRLSRRTSDRPPPIRRGPVLAA
jgi:hypothetical protein